MSTHKTIDITITWSYAMRVAILSLRDGNAEGQRLAKEEIMKCAAVADQFVEFMKGEEILLSVDGNAPVTFNEFKKANTNPDCGGDIDALSADELAKVFKMKKGDILYFGHNVEVKRVAEETGSSVDFWVRMFEPRGEEWQRDTLARLQKGVGTLETAQDNANKITALKSLLNQ